MKYISRFLKDDSAVSFGLIVIAAFLIGGTALWLMFMGVFNSLFTPYNVDISDGLVTQQNQRAMEFHQKVIYIAPIIILLGVAGWGYIRALEQRNQP